MSTDSGCKRIGDALIDCRKKMGKMYLVNGGIDGNGVENGLISGDKYGACAHLERAYIRCVVSRVCPVQGGLNRKGWIFGLLFVVEVLLQGTAM